MPAARPLGSAGFTPLPQGTYSLWRPTSDYNWLVLYGEAVVRHSGPLLLQPAGYPGPSHVPREEYLLRLLDLLQAGHVSSVEVRRTLRYTLHCLGLEVSENETFWQLQWRYLNLLMENSEELADKM